MKVLSVAIPCYNSAAYMEKCIESLLVGGDDVEILIVDDGSTDETGSIADRYQVLHPNVVRVIHQENGGHGAAVNAGLAHATGLFFKVVDSDDWVRESAYRQVLDTLRTLAGGEQHLDMLISNFVYNKTGEKRHKVMQYRASLPVGQMFAWKDVKHFRKGHYILMHSVIFRTQLLRDCGLKLPEHCFYVDNIYVFHPLPFVKTMYYLDVNFYSYNIGRADQSVNQRIMISRIDQQLRVNRLMVDYYTDRAIRPRIDACAQLHAYMYNYLEIITTISTVLAVCSYTPEDMEKKKELWDYIKEKDFWLFMKLRTGIFGISMNLPGKGGHYFTVGAYKVVQHFFNFS